MRRGLLLVLGLLPATAAAETSADEAALFDQLNVREQVLDSQRAAAEDSALQRSLLAYRLCRQRELGFAPSPETRLDDARAFDMALVALRRSADEARTLGRELDRVRTERSTIEAAFVARATGKASVDGDEPTNKATRFVRPARGVIVAVPGSRRDGSSRIELRHDGVEMLARLNEPVRSIASGTVRRVEALPQGGFAVVTVHEGGLTSIVTGLRDIVVAPGDRVSAGLTLGLAGRNLDGAAVVSVEIWRDRRAQDAARLLRVRREPPG
ncbi:MAG: M23 family metallopeptidase [Deltaproteobacteria bacterium]|jgi:murein DD-endopeptidase MepM/ murein hydrolase activator NlpD|nr:M23 family metallopeptidase [Deltaproteobacteria bacterium]